MPHIHKLDTLTVNQIAAGEVIERPSSIVKELLENALDAGSTMIRIDIEAGGIKRIRISDNGHGIHRDDLPLAPYRYATSKIQTLDDLYNTLTFGFRGEALASIAQVAQLSIVSRTAEGNAHQISAHLDDISDISEATREVGTTITVDDLFHDVPVRARFLKSASTEYSHIYGVVLHYALLNPQVDMVLTHNGEETLNTTGLHDALSLISTLFTRALGDACCEVDAQIGDIHVNGYISNPTMTFSNRNKQFISINGRLVKSPTLQKALTTIYRDLIPSGRFPFVALTITMDPQLLDVNIHPQKLDVKFLNSGFIFDALSKAIKLALTTQHRDLQETLTAPPLASPAPSAPRVVETTWYAPTMASSPTVAPVDTRQPRLAPEPAVPAVATAVPSQTPMYAEQELTTLGAEQLEYLHAFDTYIIVKALDKVWILDQHAVHERVLYEHIKTHFETQTETQPLLVSEVIELDTHQYAAYEQGQSALQQLGFDSEPFGGTQISVRAVPAKLADTAISPIVINLLDALSEWPDRQLTLTLERKEALQMRACKAAIKAGKRMPEPEVKQLIQDVITSPSNYTCPHGRPLFVTFSKSDLETLFLRS